MSLNIVLNILGTAITAVVGLITMPFLISRLGFEAYGLWALIGAASTYLALLDFSMSASLARLIAAKRATKNVEAINCLMSTGLVALLLCACLAATPVMLAAHAFLPVFHVPLSRQADTYRAFVILALGACAGFPLSIFPALGFGYERFDYENLIDIGTIVGRASLLFAFVDRHSGLADVAWIVTGSNFAGAVASGALAWRIEPRFRLRRSNVRWWAFRELAAYAVPYWSLTVTKIVPPQIGAFVIGHVLGGGESVAAFAIARQLVGYGTNLVAAAARTTTPRAALLHAAGQAEAQRTLFIRASRYALAMALILACGLMSLGQPCLTLWLRHAKGTEVAYSLLVILAIGEAFPMSQCITAAVLSGLGQNVTLVVIGLAETIVLAAVSVPLAIRYGLVGVCLAYATAGFMARGATQLVWGCHIVGVGVVTYLRRVAITVALAGAVPLSVGAALALHCAPASYVQLLVCGMVFAAIEASFLVPFLLNVSDSRSAGPSRSEPLGVSAAPERA